jgi:hypothetical protein
VQPERLAALVVRLAIYAGVAWLWSLVVHVRNPESPLGAAFVVLLGGVAAVGVARALTRRSRGAAQGVAEGRSPPA